MSSNNQAKRQDVRNTYEILFTLSELEKYSSDAERARRGYLITGNPAFWAAYDEAISDVKQNFELLKKLTKDHNSQPEMLKELTFLLNKRIEILKEIVTEIRDRDGQLKIDQRLTNNQVVMTNQLWENQKEIEIILNQMKSQERYLLKSSYNLTDTKRNINLITINTGYLISLILLIIVYNWLTQEIQARSHAETLLIVNNNNLENLVKERTIKLAENERRYRCLVQSFSEIIWSTDGQGRTKDFAQWWEDTTGQSQADVENWGWLNVVHPDDRFRVRETWEQAYRNPSFVELQYRVLQKDGKYIDVYVRAVAIKDEQDQVVEWVGTCNDITVQKQAERLIKDTQNILENLVAERTQQLAEETVEKKELGEQLKLALNDLQRSNQELEQFAYIASHDLQEPLRAIMGFTQKLAKTYQGKLDAKADTYIEFIVNGASRMQGLIRDLLSYSRVGRAQLKLQKVDCQAVVAIACQNLQIAIEESQAQIKIGKLPTVIADTVQLTNLWQNLLSNALKYRGPKNLEIDIFVDDAKMEKISQEKPLQADRSQEEWVFAIQDNGIGIEPEYAERIFGIFQRLHTSDEYPGTGLGLAICQKIVERHGGRIWVESQIGAGATFYFTLPKSV